MRKSLLLACGLVAATAACTSLLGDFSLGAGAGTSDGGPGSEGGGDDSGGAESGTCDLSAPNATAYVGQTVTLQATSSSPNPIFNWQLTPPPGSSATLVNSGTSTPTLTPDVAGTYKMALAVTADGCVKASTLVTLEASLPQVIFAQGTHGGAGGGQAAYVTADLDGGNVHQVMCADTVNHDPGLIASYAAYAGRAYDFWEAPAGQPSRYAAFTLDYVSNNYTSHLYAGTTASSCDGSAPADLGTGPFGPPAALFGSEPRFSPDGTRFVVYDAQFNVISFAADGSEHHQVAPYGAGQSGAPVFDTTGHDSLTKVYPPRVEWLSSSKGVLWARSTSSGWEIVTAPDQANATPATYMSCAGVTPREIAVLADGSVIASYRKAAGQAENLYHLSVDASHACTQVRQYTNLSSPGAVATDFAVSPDGKTIAFLQFDPAAPGASLWSLPPDGGYPGGGVFTVAVEGTANPVQVTQDPALFGPRWIGAGTMLVFTRLDKTFDGGTPATTVVVVAPDGGGHQEVAKGDGVNSFVSTSGSGACRAVPGETGAGALAGLACTVAGAVLVRRRRARAAARRV